MFAIDINDPFLVKFSQQAAHRFAGSTDQVGNLIPAQGKVKIIGLVNVIGYVKQVGGQASLCLVPVPISRGFNPFQLIPAQFHDYFI